MGCFCEACYASNVTELHALKGSFSFLTYLAVLQKGPECKWCGLLFALISLAGVVMMSVGTTNILNGVETDVYKVVTTVGGGLLGFTTCVTFVQNCVSAGAFHKINKREPDKPQKCPVKMTTFRAVCGVLLLGGIATMLVGVHCVTGDTMHIYAAVSAGLMFPGIYFQLFHPLVAKFNFYKKYLSKIRCIRFVFGGGRQAYSPALSYTDSYKSYTATQRGLSNSYSTTSSESESDGDSTSNQQARRRRLNSAPVVRLFQKIRKAN